MCTNTYFHDISRLSSIKSPPKFDGLKFPIWKVKMNLFLKSLGVRVAKAITKEFVKLTVMRIYGPKQPLRNMRPMLKPNMDLHKY